jgi:enoyl-[acyl-carrier protein] reductase I
MLPVDLKGKVALVAGVGDDQGYGWAIAKALAQAGATLIFGVWPPVYNIFCKSWEMGKFDESRRLPDGSLMQVARFVPFDAMYDTMEKVPAEVLANKRYADHKAFAIADAAEAIRQEFGSIDCLIHSLANAPEVSKPLLETSRQGYLDALSASAYSLISMVRSFGPFMPADSAVLSLTYLASVQVVPGYGGGMSSAKAALESDTRTLAWEAGRKYGIRVNTISAGPLPSRAARAIGLIERMIDYYQANAPLVKEMSADEVGRMAAVLCSPIGSAVTGATIYVDNGMHIMAVGADSPTLQPQPI